MITVDRQVLIQIITEEINKYLSDGRQNIGKSEEINFLNKISHTDEEQNFPPKNGDNQALSRMKKRTSARIGVGHTGARLKTQTVLEFRADHAKARDAVFADVSQGLLERLGLFKVKTMCDSKNMFITRPDLGRRLSQDAENVLRQKCVFQPDVQIYAADGLSSTAIEANLERILPVLIDGLNQKEISTGTPFFMEYGRVAAEDHVADILKPKVVCVLIGERPGLTTAESLSAYIVYNAHTGIPESQRTVVSNIHKNGLAAVEAGAYIVDIIAEMLKQKKSGVELKK